MIHIHTIIIRVYLIIVSNRAHLTSFRQGVSRQYVLPHLPDLFSLPFRVGPYSNDLRRLRPSGRWPPVMQLRVMIIKILSPHISYSRLTVESKSYCCPLGRSVATELGCARCCRIRSIYCMSQVQRISCDYLIEYDGGNGETKGRANLVWFSTFNTETDKNYELGSSSEIRRLFQGQYRLQNFECVIRWSTCQRLLMRQSHLCYKYCPRSEHKIGSKY
jgi:hypothetical protein